MKKPVNKFALFLWVLAVLVLAAQAAQYFTMMTSAREMAMHGDHIDLVGGAIEKLVLTGLLAAAQLASFGVLIELVDQIRWNALRRP